MKKSPEQIRAILNSLGQEFIRLEYDFITKNSITKRWAKQREAVDEAVLELSEERSQAPQGANELILKMQEALIWCSASEDFAPGGKAREGWEKMCKPLLDELPFPPSVSQPSSRPDERDELILKQREALKDLIFTAQKLWDGTPKAIMSGGAITVTHPIIEEAITVSALPLPASSKKLELMRKVVEAAKNLNESLTQGETNKAVLRLRDALDALESEGV